MSALTILGKNEKNSLFMCVSIQRMVLASTQLFQSSCSSVRFIVALSSLLKPMLAKAFMASIFSDTILSPINR